MGSQAQSAKTTIIAFWAQVYEVPPIPFSFDLSESIKMPSIGDVSLALFSGEQKTSIAASNLNFDFALVKTAPAEEYRQGGPKPIKPEESGS